MHQGGSSILSRALRHRIARFFLMIGSLGPGLFLILSSDRWGNSPIFHQVSRLWIPLWVFGLLLIVGSLLVIFSRKLRDLGYVLIAVFYFVINVSAAFAVAHGQLSALVFVLPVMLWLYCESAATATRDEELNDVTALQEREE